MKNHYITVVNNIATYCQHGGCIVLGKSDHRVTFAFDYVWSAYPNKIARFKWNGGFTDVPVENDIAAVPIIENATQVEVGVYVEGLYATTPTVIPCKEDDGYEEP